jgi:CxxC motif-containing protein
MQELVCITCPMGCRLAIRSAVEAAAETALADGGAAASVASSQALAGEAGISGELVVTGNRCPRGLAYAREELLDPRRTVTATCRLVRECAGPACSDSISPGARGGEAFAGPRRISCRTTAAFPRQKIDELLATIYATEVALPVTRGQILIANALGTGIDVIATRAMAPAG